MNCFISIEKNPYIDKRYKGEINNPWIEKKTSPLQTAIKSLKDKKLHTITM